MPTCNNRLRTGSKTKKIPVTAYRDGIIAYNYPNIFLFSLEISEGFFISSYKLRNSICKVLALKLYGTKYDWTITPMWRQWNFVAATGTSTFALISPLSIALAKTLSQHFSSLSNKDLIYSSKSGWDADAWRKKLITEEAPSPVTSTIDWSNLFQFST